MLQLHRDETARAAPSSLGATPTPSPAFGSIRRRLAVRGASTLLPSSLPPRPARNRAEVSAECPGGGRQRQHKCGQQWARERYVPGHSPLFRIVAGFSAFDLEDEDFGGQWVIAHGTSVVPYEHAVGALEENMTLTPQQVVPHDWTRVRGNLPTPFILLKRNAYLSVKRKSKSVGIFSTPFEPRGVTGGLTARSQRGSSVWLYLPSESRRLQHRHLCQQASPPSPQLPDAKIWHYSLRFQQVVFRFHAFLHFGV